jgi:hypothetical protein
MGGAAPILAVSLLLWGCDLVTPPVVPAGPPISCEGLPARICNEIVNDARRNAQPGSLPVTIRAVCQDAAGCSDAAGTVLVDIVYSNGRRDTYSMSWAGAGGAPFGGEAPAAGASLPIEPACDGVPPGPCRDNAFVGLQNGGIDPEPLDVQRIDVRCSAACTDTGGDGTTTVTYADGTTHATSWTYVGPDPTD